MKALTDEIRGPEYHYFLNAWTKLDTFYFQILKKKIKKRKYADQRRTFISVHNMERP